MALKTPILVGYLLFKLSAIQVDAIEAVAQGHISRARMLSKESSELANNIRRVLEWKKEAAKAAEPANAAVKQDSSNASKPSGAQQEQKKKRTSILLDG